MSRSKSWLHFKRSKSRLPFQQFHPQRFSPYWRRVPYGESSCSFYKDNICSHLYFSIDHRKPNLGLRFAYHSSRNADYRVR